MRTKALNIFLKAAIIAIPITAVLTVILTLVAGREGTLSAIVIGPVTTYIIGRILCFKEYEDETP